MTPSPHDIAKSLSEAQRRWIMAKGAGPRAATRLRELGLIELLWPGYPRAYKVTSLGQAVRSILKEQEDG